jgi:sugar phosphate isomerase/epimerase
MTTRQKGNTYYKDYSLTLEAKEQYAREYGYDGIEFL